MRQQYLAKMRSASALLEMKERDIVAFHQDKKTMNINLPRHIIPSHPSIDYRSSQKMVNGNPNIISCLLTVEKQNNIHQSPTLRNCPIAEKLSV